MIDKMLHKLDAMSLRVPSHKDSQVVMDARLVDSGHID